MSKEILEGGVDLLDIPVSIDHKHGITAVVEDSLAAFLRPLQFQRPLVDPLLKFGGIEPEFFHQAGIFEGNGRLSRKGVQAIHVVGGKKAWLRTVQIQEADYLSAHLNR